MKYFIVLMFFIAFGSAYAEMLDVDYNFIENAFSGIKPVTDKEFEDTINRMTPKPLDNSFKGKLKTFLFGRQYGVDPAPKGQDKEVDIGGETKAVQDIKNGVYYIKLFVSVIGEGGNIIPMGNYKIKQDENNPDYLVFYQGATIYGKLKLKSFDDTLKEKHQIAYSRIDVISDDVVRIVYSTIDDTRCAIARVYQ